MKAVSDAMRLCVSSRKGPQCQERRALALCLLREVYHHEVVTSISKSTVCTNQGAVMPRAAANNWLLVIAVPRNWGTAIDLPVRRGLPRSEPLRLRSGRCQVLLMA